MTIVVIYVVSMFKKKISNDSIEHCRLVRMNIYKVSNICISTFMVSNDLW